MPDSMAVVENGAQAVLAFVLFDHLGLYLVAPNENLRHFLGVRFWERRQITLKSAEEGGIIDDAVFNHFSEAGSKFALCVASSTS